MSERTKCWCGEKVPRESFVPVPREPCGGLGTLECMCGGDFCVCHNHGEVECPGCDDCSDSDGGDPEDCEP